MWPHKASDFPTVTYLLAGPFFPLAALTSPKFAFLGRRWMPRIASRSFKYGFGGSVPFSIPAMILVVIPDLDFLTMSSRVIFWSSE